MQKDARNKLVLPIKLCSPNFVRFFHYMFRSLLTLLSTYVASCLFLPRGTQSLIFTFCLLISEFTQGRVAVLVARREDGHSSDHLYGHPFAWRNAMLLICSFAPVGSVYRYFEDASRMLVFGSGPFAKCQVEFPS